MRKKQKKAEELQEENRQKRSTLLRKKNIKELIAPSGIDARDIDNLEIISNVKRYARSFFISTKNGIISRII